MSDYRRWISYIYAYENGTKKKNAGYAKLELKDGKLTMTLHVTPDNREGNYRVCLYKNQSGRREGVLLGNMEKKQGGEGIRFIEDASDLKGSGLLFQEMNGLLLYDDRGKYLISSWEDDPVEIPVVQEIIALLEQRRENTPAAGKDTAEQRIEIEENGEAKVFDKKAEPKVVERTEREVQAADSGERETRAFADREGRMREDSTEMERRGRRESIDREQRKDLSEIFKTQENVNVKIETEEKEEKGTKTEARGQMTEPAVRVLGEKNPQLRAESADHPAPPPSMENVQPEERTTQMQIKELESRTGEGTEGVGRPSVPNEDKRKEDDKGGDDTQKVGRLESRVFSCLSTMYPFEHQEFERSVRMEPQDIGLLPREMWKYAGNSFLLHSYYAYHHLLFARKVRKEKRNCYLMLPGIYNPKEQHMAQLFGFSRFCPVRKKALQQGDFGYWYMEVEFPDA